MTGHRRPTGTATRPGPGAPAHRDGMLAAPPLVYAADELALLARLTGTPLPAALRAGWPEPDRGVADVVSARTLLARGALALEAGERVRHQPGQPGPPAPDSGDQPGALRVSGAVARLLAPLREATLVLQTGFRGPAGPPSVQVAVTGPAGGLRLLEREPDVWQVDPGLEVVTATVDALAEGLARAVAGPPVSFTVPSIVLDRARRLHGAGWSRQALALLGEHGVAGTAAAVWGAALDAGQGEVWAHLARRDEAQRYTLAEVSWWDAGHAGVWRLTSHDDPATGAGMDGGPMGDAGSTGPGQVTVAGAHPDELRAALAELAALAWHGREGRIS